MPCERNGVTVDDEPRISDSHRSGMRVAPFLFDDGTIRPSENPRLDHRVKAMTEGFVRHVIVARVDPVVIFRTLIADHDGAFWLDDSLSETMS